MPRARRQGRTDLVRVGDAVVSRGFAGSRFEEPEKPFPNPRTPEPPSPRQVNYSGWGSSPGGVSNSSTTSGVAAGAPVPPAGVDPLARSSSGATSFAIATT